MDSHFIHPFELELVNQRASMYADRWRPMFEQFDHEGYGEIQCKDFQVLLRDPVFQREVTKHQLEVLEHRSMQAAHPTISYQEFINIMSNKRTRSFQLAVHCRDGDIFGQRKFSLHEKHSCFQSMVRRIAKEFLTDERDRQYYSDRYSCCPPPLFMPLVTLIEIGFFIYYSVEVGHLSPMGPVPSHSLFIYRPDKRAEFWRFIFYMFIHAGWIHLFFNMLIQLVVGVPLEMVHGSWRIGIVYLTGVLAGSLGMSVFDKDAYLVGASGGVYALLAAHLANILLNYSEMELGLLKLGGIFIIASADVGFAIWDRYSSDDVSPPVAYVAHLMGALAGLTIGLLVLKNFEQKLHIQAIWWIVLGIYVTAMIFAILWNIFYY